MPKWRRSLGLGQVLDPAMVMEHPQVVERLHRRLVRLLAVRRALMWLTVGAFGVGSLILAGRVAGATRGAWISGCMGILVPIGAAAVVYEWRRRPSREVIRAVYDEWRRCGGIVMSEEQSDMRAWYSRLPSPELPRLRWHWYRTGGSFLAATGFLAVVVALPDGWVRPFAGSRLEIGQWVEQLQLEARALAEEAIVDPEQARELTSELERMRREASGRDPARTWEALDHLAQLHRDKAEAAAEEAVRALAELTQIESLAEALQQALESGLAAEQAAVAARELARMLRDLQGTTQLQGGKMNQLGSGLNFTNVVDLEQLRKVLGEAKQGLSNSVARLAHLQLLEARWLGLCRGACQSTNLAALLAFLRSGSCTNGEGLRLGLRGEMPGAGGVDRGRADAPMTWKDPTAEEGAEFREQALPLSAALGPVELLGVSLSAPDRADPEVKTEHGALAGAAAGGGSAHAAVILPRHREVVQRFFERRGP